MRTEAQKQAEKRYYEKKKNYTAQLNIRLSTEDLDLLEDLLLANSINKSCFIRWAIAELQKQTPINLTDVDKK